MLKAVASLGEKEVRSIVEEQGKVEVTCECGGRVLPFAGWAQELLLGRVPGALVKGVPLALLRPWCAGDFCAQTYQFSEQQVLDVIQQQREEQTVSVPAQ